MSAFRSFMSHKFTIRQSLFIIAAAVLAGLAANGVSEAAGLPDSAVTVIGVAAAISTLLPIAVVFYRRAHA